MPGLLSPRKGKKEESEEVADGAPVSHDFIVSWPLKKTEQLKIEKNIQEWIIQKHGRGRKSDWGPQVHRLGDMRMMIEESPSKCTDREHCERYLKAHHLYAALLTHATPHFPLDDGRLGFTWTWTDTDGANKCSSHRVSTEIAAVLFNAAVLHCMVAAELKQDLDGLTRAIRHYQTAAGLWDAALEKVSGEERATKDLSEKVLSLARRMAICHAMHTFYLLKAAENPDDIRVLTSSETLARIAMDVAEQYHAAHPLCIQEDIQSSVPKHVFYQAEVWWQIFEMRAFLHHSRVLFTAQKYGDAVAYIRKARECLHRAEGSARLMKNGRLYSVIHCSKADLELAQEKAVKANKDLQQPVEQDSSKLPPILGTGRPPMLPVRATDIYMASCPTNPFESVPLLGEIKPRVAPSQLMQAAPPVRMPRDPALAEAAAAARRSSSSPRSAPVAKAPGEEPVTGLPLGLAGQPASARPSTTANPLGSPRVAAAIPTDPSGSNPSSSPPRPPLVGPGSPRTDANPQQESNAGAGRFHELNPRLHQSPPHLTADRVRPNPSSSPPRPPLSPRSQGPGSPRADTNPSTEPRRESHADGGRFHELNPRLHQSPPRPKVDKAAGSARVRSSSADGTRRPSGASQRSKSPLTKVMHSLTPRGMRNMLGMHKDKDKDKDKDDR